jgi:hypothetical protein
MNPIDVPMWQPMGIVDGSAAGATPTFSFPNMAKHGWLCSTTGQTGCGNASCPNNSPSQGKVFYDAITDSNLTVTGVTKCAGAEGVAQGTDPDTGGNAGAAVESDMAKFCKQQ